MPEPSAKGSEHPPTSNPESGRRLQTSPAEGELLQGVLEGEQSRVRLKENLRCGLMVLLRHLVHLGIRTLFQNIKFTRVGLSRCADGHAHLYWVNTPEERERNKALRLQAIVCNPIALVCWLSNAPVGRFSGMHTFCINNLRHSHLSHRLARLYLKKVRPKSTPPVSWRS